MPVKRYEVDGNPYDVSDAKEQEFLSKFSNAVLIGVLDEDTNEVIIQEETQDFTTSAVEDADAVQQPMTASQALMSDNWLTGETTELDTESISEDISSESQDPKPRYLEFKSGIVVYEDTYLETKAGKPGYPPTFDEYAAAFGSTPKDFSAEETTIKATPSADKLIELKEVANNRVYNKKTKKFESTGINQELFSFEEEGGVKIYNKLFEGSNIDFVETDAQKEGFKGGGPGLDYGAGETIDLTDLGLEAIKARILDPETGEYVYSEALEFESDGSIANSDKLEGFIEANKDNVNVPGWTRGKNKLVGQYKNWLNTEYNPMLKKAEFSASEQYLTNDDLFKPITKTKTATGLGGGYTWEETIQPYQSEVTKEINKLKAKNPIASAQEIEDKAKLNVRTNLYEASRNDAIWSIRQKFIENSSNKDEAQAFLYASETFVKDKEAKAYNESSEKSQVAAGEIEKNIDDGKFVVKVYSQGLSDDTENNKINEIAKKYQVQVVPSANTVSNTEFNSKFNLPKDAKVSENLYNLINAIDISREANANDYKEQVKKSNDAIANISDLSTSMDATAKNYELTEKYAANIGLGFSDIGVGIGYLGGSILTLGQSNKLKELGSEYVEATNNIRNSYVRDVSIDDAFSSAGNTGKFVAQEVSNQIPILVSMMMSGGAASFVVGASSMGGKMMDMENEIATGRADYSGAEVWLKSAGYGLAEGVFSELTTVPILNRAKLNWMGAGKEQIIDSSTRAYFKSQYKGLIYEPLSEAVGEIATTGTQNLIDGKPVMQNMKHSGISGLGFGFAFAAIPFMKGMYNSQFSTYKSREEIRNLQKELKDLGIKLDKSLLTKDKRKIERDIKFKTEELNNKIQEQDYIIKNNFTSGGIESVSKLINIQADLENQAKEIQADGTIDSDTRKKLISDLQNKYNNIIQAKQKALSLRSITGNQTEWEAFKGLDRSKSKEYLDIAESILSGENGGKKVGKEAINAKAYDLYFGDLVREENKKLGRKNSSLFKNFKSFETVEDAINDLDAQPDLDPKEKQRIIKGLKNGNDGYADPNTKAQVAVVENQVANQRRYTKTHEVGHQAFWSLLGNKQNNAAFKGISNQLLETLKSTDEKVYNQLLEDGIRDDDGNIDPTEVISRFLEYVNEDKITNVQKAKGIAGLFGVMVQKEFNKDYNFDFRGEQDIFNFVVGMAKKIKDGTLTTADIKKAKESKVIKDLPTSSVDTKKATTAFSRIISPNAEFLRDELTNEELVASVKSKATEDVFSVAQAIVEKNFGLIRDSNVLTFDKSNPAQINAVKEILEEQILGVFEGSGRGKYSARKTGLFNAYESTKEDGASPSTYLLGVIKTRKPEIDIALKERTIKSEGDSIDSDQAKQVVDKSTKTSVVVDKLAKKPTETTKFKSNYISPEFKKSLDTDKSEKQSIEDKISSIVKESFKDRAVSRFKETGKIPQKLAQLYADMFGIKTTSALIEKQRNLQKLDQEGAVRARQFLIDNAPSDFARLPRSKDDTGKATGILQTKIGKVLYNKAGELTGGLKTYTDIIKGKNITLEGYDGKQYEFNQLDNEGNKKPIYRDAQHIKAALDFHIRNRALETLIPEQGKRIQAGAKFSKGQLLDVTQARDINSVAKILNISKITVNDTNRVQKQRQMEEAIVASNIPSWMFEGSKFANFARRKVDGVYVDLPAKGGLYYGGKDPAYKKALALAKQNDTNSGIKPPRRVNIKKAFTKEGQQQGQDNLKALEFFGNKLADAVAKGEIPIEIASLFVSSGYQATSGIIKVAAPFRYLSKDFKYGTIPKQMKGEKFREEHNPPASVIGATLIYGIATNNMANVMPDIKKNYYQTKLSKLDDQKLDEAKLDATLPLGTTIADNPAIRFVEADIDLNSIANYETGKTMAEELGVSLNPSDINLDNVAEQNKILKDLILDEGEYKNPQAYLNNFVKLSSKTKASKINNNNTPSNTKFSKNVTNQKALDNLGNIDKALSIARNADAPVKKIRVFDFDDTLATTKSNVLYTMPGESIVYNGSPKSFSELGKRTGFIFLATEIKEAQEYANSNRGDVKPITVNNNKIATEENVIAIMEELGIATDEGLLYEMIDPRFEDFFIGKKNIDKVKESLKKNGYGGFKYEDGSQISSKGTESIAIIDKSIIKETSKINAATFAKEAGNMEAEGAQWDFSEFSKVMQGSKGPLLDVAKFINDAKGERDVFVLTARPQDAAGPIQEFLSELGLNIPLGNITGLGDGTAQAKARWMVDKAAEGYNDFYFADDASKNVKAVRDALSVLDVKSKVQQAYVKFSSPSKLSKDFNRILEGATGIASEKIYGSAKAQVAGANRGKVFRGIAYSAQDFVGLLYETLGKGKEGDAQMAWYKKNLLDPYARAMNDLSSARLAMMNDYRALKKQLGIVPKNLRKKLPGEPWTREQAVRVYVWSKQGTEVPGISKNDLKDLNGFVANNAELQVFADQLIAIQKGDMYPEPGESWVSGSISTDMLRGLNTIKRVKYLEQWQANVDAIFSKENKNKLEAAYGIKYVKALENSLERMKTGRNRSFSDDSLTGRFTDWLQGSVGAIMFFNTRSAVLQTLSAVNFVNFTDNNPYAAAKAFGNQKQYWKDFTTLMNSDFLKERRSGLRMNVNEADIADMAKQEGPRGVINKLLQLGFAPTQIADSFAIASGGATFYRNRAKTYMKEGMDQAQAEEKAFQDFRENAEESQQSSRPDKISAQQAGPLGRLILAFANTPAQYARLTDKAIRDLKNGRGDAKTNISKIIYYTTVQNLIFNTIQQALFAMAFDEEEVEDEKAKEKYINVANGMADSLLRGTGIAGSVVSVGKNAIIRIINESKKKRPKYEKVGYELTKISPPVSAKLSRINQAARAYEWNKEEMMTKGFSLDNPAFLASGNVVSALTNIPLDRVVKKVNNVVKATESDMELWERVALFAGWQDWELGIKEEKKIKKSEKLIKRKQTFKKRKFKTRKFN